MHLFFALSLLSASPDSVPEVKIDMPSLQDTYREGGLEKVKMDLESYLKDKNGQIPKEEQIFIFKYLGVIYASNPDEKIRAENYFNQLLTVAPYTELTGLSVSQDIQKIFKEVKHDFQIAQEYSANNDQLDNPFGAAEAGSVPESKSHAWIWWTTGLATVAAGAGVATWILLPEKLPAPVHFDGSF